MGGARVKRMGRRRRRRRRRTSVNRRVINDVGNIPPSKLTLHRPVQWFISTEGAASLRHPLEDLEACHNNIIGIPTPRINLAVAP
eukprot:4910723-Pyramimonas_sp.AAC.1